MTNTPDLDLRRRVAEKLGWTEVKRSESRILGRPLLGVSPSGGWTEVPEWELSLDACLRDLVPVAKVQGWLLELQDAFFNHPLSWQARFYNHKGYTAYQVGRSAATAFCRAWLELPEKVKEESE